MSGRPVPRFHRTWHARVREGKNQGKARIRVRSLCKGSRNNDANKDLVRDDARLRVVV